jgi:MFS transporter, DHA1 family, multidrug resistance protein
MGKDETPRPSDADVLRPPAAIDWQGSDDPDNPRNFSRRRRLASAFAVTFLAFVSTLAGSLYSPAHQEVSKEFGVVDEIAILPLSLYNFGMAFGPLIGAPLSETFGRKAVFLTTSPLFAIFTLGAGFSQNAAALIVCRFLAGVFASPAISNASATLVDYTAGRYRAVLLSFYYSIPFFGAVFG